MKKYFNLLLMVLITTTAALLTMPSKALADSFGVSPSSVSSELVQPGTKYKQKVFISREDVGEALKATVTIEDSEMKDWIKVSSEVVDIPKGQSSASFEVSIDVPSSAKIQTYTGKIKVLAKPDLLDGSVNIEQGAEVEVRLALTKDSIKSFKVRQISLENKNPINRALMLSLKIENNGNVKTAPTKVDLVVKDLNKNVIDTYTTKNIKTIDPFETETVSISFNHKLAVGQYLGNVVVYKGDEVVLDEPVQFDITEKEEVKDSKDSDKDQKASKDLIIGVSVSAVLLIVGLVIFILFKKKDKEQPKQEEKK